MESITRFRQDETIRFMRWQAENPAKARLLLNAIQNESNTENVIKSLEYIKENEFFILLPLILDKAKTEQTIEKALHKAQIEKLENALRYSTISDVCDKIINLVKNEIEE